MRVSFESLPPHAVHLTDPGQADATMRLPAGAPARVEFIAGVIRGLADAFNVGDIERFVGFHDPEVEMRTGVDGTGGVWAGLDAVYRGHEGLVKAAEHWGEPWSELALHPQELIDLGGDRFIVLGAWRGRGRGSGIEVDTPAGARYTLRGGKIVLLEWFGAEEDAPDP
jgi:SnoaL-like domain